MAKMRTNTFGFKGHGHYNASILLSHFFLYIVPYWPMFLRRLLQPTIVKQTDKQTSTWNSFLVGHQTRTYSCALLANVYSPMLLTKFENDGRLLGCSIQQSVITLYLHEKGEVGT